MRATRWIGLSVLIGVAVMPADCFVVAGTSGPAGSRNKLPGALPVIDATEYAGLQAAIAALPSCLPATYWWMPPRTAAS